MDAMGFVDRKSKNDQTALAPIGRITIGNPLFGIIPPRRCLLCLVLDFQGFDSDFYAPKDLEK